MDCIFSPFNALGLPAGKHDPNVIALAFARAMLARHPDKQDDRDRWPQPHHIQAAKAILSRHLDTALEKYRGYPQTFFPEQRPFFREPVYPNLPRVVTRPELKQCQYCQMVLSCIDWACDAFDEKEEVEVLRRSVIDVTTSG